MLIRKLRLIRRKYNISLAELGNACGLSQQRISEIELGTENVTEATREKLRAAFIAVASLRRECVEQLQEDLEFNAGTLFDLVEETDYGL